MKSLAQVLFLTTSIGASYAQAAPVTVFSQLSLESTFVVNSGNPIPGALVRGNQGPITVSGAASSSVDAVDTNESVISAAQVGNPFSDPPLPFLSSRTDATSLQGSPLEGAQGSFDVATTQSANISTGQVLNRTIDTAGSASILFATDTIDASGLSFFDFGRPFLVENTSNASVAFDISGFFTADLFAEVSGAGGFARSRLEYILSFEETVGATVTYSEIIPFTELVEDTALGAVVTQSFATNDNGFLFYADAVSDSENGGGLASTAAGAGYRFSVELDAGVSFFMTEGWRQRNEVAIRQQDTLTPVPLPAGGLMLLSAFGGLAGFRLRNKASHGKLSFKPLRS